MEQSFVPRDLDDILTPTGATEGQGSVVRRLPSYRATPWAIVNRVLDIVDDLTNGRADWVQRLFTYLLFGGTAAVVNLIVFFLMYHVLRLPASVSDIEHNVLAQVVSFEISLMTNFIPNDYFTFRHLNGHTRSWRARCLRFHLTSIVGFFLTMFLEFAFTYYGHITAIFSQAIAILLVLVYNFSFHHLFTYRHVKQPAAAPALLLTVEPADGEQLDLDEDTLKRAAVRPVASI